MSVIFILIAVSLLVAIGFLIAFIWSIRAGQFDDDYTPSVRILFDDEKNVVEDEKAETGEAVNPESGTRNSEPGIRNPEFGTNT